MKLLPLLGLAAAALAQQYSAPPSDEALGVSDGRGGFYSVSNRKDEGPPYFQVTKLASNGGVRWNAAFNPGVAVWATAVAIDNEGSLLVAGTFWNGAQRDILVVKFSATGNLQ